MAAISTQNYCIIQNRNLFYKMNSTRRYLFTSARLGFRGWLDEDIDTMAAINADPVVMEFFPSELSHQQSAAFIERMQQEFNDKGFCYYAVDILLTGECIGFIGLHEQVFEATFTPCIDIGWRLGSAHWNKGFATEGAKRCLDYAFQDLGLTSIYAITPIVNKKSEAVMKKIGMQQQLYFNHPLLANDKRLEACVLYKIIPQSSTAGVVIQ
jgi:RimJ/RimL family protein N-acetyltransferase